METRQLVLIADEPSRDWRLDDHTRQVGRAGIAAARDALRAARRTAAAPAAVAARSAMAEVGRHTEPHHPHAA